MMSKEQSSMDPIKVLNHGFVRLVDSMGSDLSISRAARVSYDAPPREEDRKLIRFLMEHSHTSPFESVTMTFEVAAPIFVFRQWHRHRTQSYNELSARYRPLPNMWYVPSPQQVGVQSKHNKQMRDDTENPHSGAISEMIDDVCGYNYRAYETLLKLGCPRELARGVLPVNMYSHMFTTMNLLNCFRFLSERLHPHAQYEIRVYAEAMLKLVNSVAPIACEAFQDFWLVGHEADRG